jgi:hypothetical protein
MRNAFALDNFLPHERTHCIRNTLHWSSEAWGFYIYYTL